MTAGLWISEEKGMADADGLGRLNRAKFPRPHSAQRFIVLEFVCKNPQPLPHCEIEGVHAPRVGERDRGDIAIAREQDVGVHR